MSLRDAPILITFLIFILSDVLIKDGLSTLTRKCGMEGSSPKPVLTVFGIAYILYRAMVARGKSMEKDEKMVYGLQHGRLHIQTPTAMWMRIEHLICWTITYNLKDRDEKVITREKTMAEACRDLLDEVLTHAGFDQNVQGTRRRSGDRHKRCLIDVGIGCGDQTIYLMSGNPVRACDEAWWGERDREAIFSSYIGITNDPTQAQYACERTDELKRASKEFIHDITVYCADASQPESWSAQLRSSIQTARSGTQETWLLALDTAYHFSPSRWPLITHTCRNLEASFLAFDLCLSPTASFRQKLTLRFLTMLMGAPWANFVTPEQYRRNLVKAGYEERLVSVVDVSEHVFASLAKFMEEQDRRLKTLGLGLGRFKVARKMFAWWGRSGVVRGIIVVAKQEDKKNIQDTL